MIARRKTRTVKIGNVKIGSEHPVAIQSMTKTDTSDIGGTVAEIHALEGAGCEIVRAAVRDIEDARAISLIKKEVNIPLVADVHFDYTLALEAIKQGVDKIRINPGNISKGDQITSIIDSAKDAGIPIRIGLNSGSLPGGDMTESALKYVDIFRKRSFEDIVISLKTSNVATTIDAYKKIADKCDYPLHVGVTAAGTPADGIVRSCAGIGALLLAGIGDTLRISLAGEAVHEVDTAKRLLSSLGLRTFGASIIACPTCGRCRVDLISIINELENKLRLPSTVCRLPRALTIAVMGCEVNGPGEAKEADIGIAFGEKKGVIFKSGEILKTVEADKAVDELIALIREEK